MIFKKEIVMSGKLNCRPGDLAIVLAPKSGASCSATGRIVTAVSLQPAGRCVTPDGLEFEDIPVGASYWLVLYSRPMPQISMLGTVRASIYDVIRDSRLRPIRDQPGDDETLSWISIPGEKVDHA